MRACTAVLFGVLALAACEDDGISPDTPGMVHVTPAMADVTQGDTVRLTAVLTSRAGDTLDLPLTWSSRDSTMARVSDTGLVTARAPGQVLITARRGGASGSAIVRIAAAPAPVVVRVDLGVDSLIVMEGGSERLTAIPRDAGDQPIPGLAPMWQSSDPSTARVDAGGLVTPVRPGTATISAKVNGRTGSAVVEVRAAYEYDLVYVAWDGVPGSPTAPYVLDINDPAPTPAPLFADSRPADSMVPSPDGRRIAFLGMVDGLPGMWVAERDGSDPVRVHDNSVDCGRPTFSPDGERLAFQCWPMNEAPDIWVVNSDGTGLNNLTRDSIAGQLSPAWSPVPVDGEYRIAYTHNQDGEMAIRTMRASDGGDIRVLTSGYADDQAAWSPDGATIAFTRAGGAVFGDIYLVDADGENARALVVRAGPQWSPVWSPDGILLAFTSRHETYGSDDSIDQVYTIRTDTRVLARRTGDATGKSEPAWLPRNGQ